MNSTLRTLVLLALFCACFAPGCNTPRAHDMAAGTARRMSEMSKVATSLSGQIAETTGSLQSVVANARSDPREAYAAFSRNVGNLRKMTEETTDLRDTLEKQGRAYFAEWEKSNRSIGDESLRRKADQRKSRVHEDFKATQKELDEALDALGPLVSQLEDVRTYLSSDLSSAGIESLRGKIGDLGSKGRAIQKQLAGVDESVMKLLPDLGTFATAPKETEGDRTVR